ncbi:MAG: TolC family protein [Polyangiaceae bacterium]|nr:TolC family protein [Polyangiaceae bacterium]
MRILLLLALTTLAGPARAAPVRMDLAEAMRRAEQVAPALGPRRAAVQSGGELARAADQKLSVPPRVEVEVGPRFRSDPSRAGVDATLGLWQDLPLGGLGSARSRWASAARGEAAARLSVTLQEVRAEAALSWIEVRLARELERIRGESLQHALTIAKLAGARVRAGSVPPSEEASAQALAGRARAEVLDAEGRRFVAETALRHLTGTQTRTLEVDGPLELVDQPLALPELVARARAGQPDVLAADAAAARSERALEMTRAFGKPSLSVGPSVTREATGDFIVLARASFPLPVVSPGALETARARSEAAVQRAEARHVRASLERELDLAVHERKHARELRDALREGVIGPAREALRQSLAQYEAGSIDTATVLSARRELLAAEERWAEAAADVRRADIRLMRLVGRDPRELGTKGRR